MSQMQLKNLFWKKKNGGRKAMYENLNMASKCNCAVVRLHILRVKTLALYY